MTWLHKQGIYNMQACQTQLRLNQYVQLHVSGYTAELYEGDQTHQLST